MQDKNVFLKSFHLRNNFLINDNNFATQQASLVNQHNQKNHVGRYIQFC